MPHSTPKEPWHVPVSWIRDFGHGRVFYSNFGHNEATWNDKKFQDHYLAGILWALGRINAPVTPNPDLQALYDSLIAQGSVSEQAAMEVGVVIEETDIADIDVMISETTESDVLAVLDSLRSGSVNHLAAFQRQLA
jgi:hypothetical protein